MEDMVARGSGREDVARAKGPATTQRVPRCSGSTSPSALSMGYRAGLGIESYSVGSRELFGRRAPCDPLYGVHW